MLQLLHLQAASRSQIAAADLTPGWARGAGGSPTSATLPASAPAWSSPRCTAPLRLLLLLLLGPPLPREPWAVPRGPWGRQSGRPRQLRGPGGSKVLLCGAPAEALACETWAGGWTRRNVLCLPALVPTALLRRPGRKLRPLLRARVARLLLEWALLWLHHAGPWPRLWEGRKMRLLRRVASARWLLRGQGQLASPLGPTRSWGCQGNTGVVRLCLLVAGRCLPTHSWARLPRGRQLRRLRLRLLGAHRGRQGDGPGQGHLPRTRGLPGWLAAGAQGALLPACGSAAWWGSAGCSHSVQQRRELL